MWFALSLLLLCSRGARQSKVQYSSPRTQGYPASLLDCITHATEQTCAQMWPTKPSFFTGKMPNDSEFGMRPSLPAGSQDNLGLQLWELVFFSCIVTLVAYCRRVVAPICFSKSTTTSERTEIQVFYTLHHP